MMFNVVNQFNLDEFQSYTNFPDIMKTLFSQKCTDTELNRYIQLNFEKNIPRKALWLAGGFSSLKLTGGFYDSEAAARIFRNIYGTKWCRIELCAYVEAEIESQSSTIICKVVDTPNQETIADFFPDINATKVRQNHFISRR